MCGRFTLEPTGKFYERFNIENRLETLTPRYNIAPSQMVPVIISKSPNTVMMMRWGLIPHWAKDEKIGYKMINARIETVKEKPSFKNLLKDKRCLVPSTGYYEWKTLGKTKYPYFIRLQSKEMFAFAGLYEVWKNKKGEEIYTFTLMTTESQGELRDIHDRMPVIINRNIEEQWLDKSIQDIDAAYKLIEHNTFGFFDMFPVSREVNKPVTDNRSLIEPLSAQERIHIETKVVH